MKNNKLNSRQKEIIKILTKSTINSPITTSMIAKELFLSSRTVLREMPKIEAWLDENEFNFIKKPGVGLIIDENLENQQLILELLEVEKIKKEYSKEERKKIIVGELLTTKEPLKLFYFTSQLKVSEGTLSGDLDNIAKWLEKFNIKLIRKPGLGIYVQGEENDFRKALVSLLYDSINENELIEVVKEVGDSKRDKEVIEVSVKNKLLKFIDRDIIKSVEKTVGDLEDALDIKLADNAYIGLVVHLALAIQRIKNNEKISMDEETLKELSKLPEFSMAEKIVKVIEKEFNIDIPKGEVGYITMHLKGAKLRLNSKTENFNLSNLDIKQVAYHIISTAEKEFGVYLREDGRLIIDLTNHLVPAVSRLKMKLNIRNPLLENIKENYSREFEICSKACDILKIMTNLSEIPESEIAYITMHIAAALENNVLDEKVRVVIACHTGVGTSRLLMSIIEKDFKNIQVMGTISSINIDVDKLKEDGVDFIISTVELKVDYKYIRVNAIITKQDKMLIEDNIRRVLKKKKYEKIAKKNYIENDTKNIKEIPKINRKGIRKITDLGENIISFIDTVALKEIKEVASIKELIHEGSFIFAHDDESAKKIEEKLMERELIATTYLSKLNIMLLHCKVSCIDGIRFGYIRLEKPLKKGDKLIKGGIIELVTDKFDNIHSEIMGEINESLIERDEFIRILKEKSEEDILKEIEEILINLYKKEIEKSFEDLNNDD
ncbi:MAG: BglG family transcription antiterminator [Clostridium perfringens]|nr:BglG family transcription antiterminator [Clostridium perfringens]